MPPPELAVAGYLAVAGSSGGLACLHCLICRKQPDRQATTNPAALFFTISTIVCQRINRKTFENTQQPDYARPWGCAESGF